MKKLFLLVALFPLALMAQNGVLTADDALKIGLKSNYDIIVERNNASADSILNSPGEAGMLPTVAATGGITINQNNIHQRYSNGNDIVANGAQTQIFTGGVLLNWTLFDGTKMFVTKEKLGVIQAQGEYQFRSQVLNSSAAILLAYYDIVRQKVKLNAINEVIKANEERLRITQAKNTSGLGPKTDANQAKIDLNTQQENKLLQEEALAIAKRNLNALLAREVNTAFDVIDSIPEGPLPDRQQLEQKMYASNPDLLVFKSQVDIQRLTMRENRTQYFPRLNAQAGYNFNRNENSAGFSLYNQSYGWQTGLTLTIPIYQAGRVRRSVEVASLDLQSAEAQLAQQNLQQSLQLQNWFSNFDMKVKMITLEKENVQLARENMQVSLDRLRLGQGTALEVQLAQVTLSNTLVRLADLQYEMKTADINLHRLAADI